MTRSKILIVLSILCAVFAAAAAAAGLFTRGGDGPFTFTSLHGQVVEMAGSGLYAFDTAFKTPINRGTDAVMLLILVPVLLFALYKYQRRGGLRASVFLTAVLGVFLYNALSLGFGVAYNRMILVYIAYFSCGLFAFVLAFSSVDLRALGAAVGPRLPARGIAIFMFFAGLSAMIWLNDIIGAMRLGGVPDLLGPYHTEITYVLDLGVIVPTAYLTGVLLLRRHALGYLLAAVMLTLNAAIGLIVISQTLMQAAMGIILSPGQYIGYVGTFVVMGSIALALAARLFANLKAEGVNAAGRQSQPAAP